MPVQKIIVFHLRRREKTDVYSKVLVIVLIIKMLRNKEEQVLLVVLRNSDMAFCPVLSVDGNALGTVSCAIVKRYVYTAAHIWARAMQNNVRASVTNTISKNVKVSVSTQKATPNIAIMQ